MMEPTARGDLQAALLRRWYEQNRETFWARHKPGIIGAAPDRAGVHADGFMLALIAETARIGRLSDSELCAE
jgi:hypothetical protein